MSRNTRHSLLSWMCSLRGRDLHKFCCSFPVILFKEASFHTAGFTLADNVLIDFLPPGEVEVYSEDFETLILSLLRTLFENED
jgi:hypothetical protein